MEKLFDKRSHDADAQDSPVRNNPVLKGVMQVLFILTLILLVFAVKFKG